MSARVKWEEGEGELQGGRVDSGRNRILFLFFSPARPYYPEF